MSFEKYKKKFINQNIFNYRKLDTQEVAQIPKSDRETEYEYLKKHAYFLQDGQYYKNIEPNIEDKDLLLFTNMKMLDVLRETQSDVKKLRIVVNNIRYTLGTLIILALILIVMSIFR